MRGGGGILSISTEETETPSVTCGVGIRAWLGITTSIMAHS